MVVVSALDLLQLSDAARAAHAAAVRERLRELNTQLGMRLPVYMIVTKSDMLAGFTEFFDDLGRDERERVWGVTFPYGEDVASDDRSAPLGRFPAEFGPAARAVAEPRAAAHAAKPTRAAAR